MHNVGWCGEEGMKVEETGNHARGRIKVKGGKDKTSTTGDLKRVAVCLQRSKIADYADWGG